MKTTIHIIIILMLSAGSLLSQKGSSSEQLLSNDLDITVINESNIYLGEYYPDSIEPLYNKRMEFRIDGIENKLFNWEINDIIDNEVSFTLKFFGSPDGNNWTEVNRQGSKNLNENGNYFLKIEIIQLKININVKEGDIENYFTVSVDY
jgi:hypothetical protein